MEGFGDGESESSGSSGFRRDVEEEEYFVAGPAAVAPRLRPEEAGASVGAGTVGQKVRALAGLLTGSRAKRTESQYTAFGPSSPGKERSEDTPEAGQASVVEQVPTLRASQTSYSDSQVIRIKTSQGLHSPEPTIATQRDLPMVLRQESDDRAAPADASLTSRASRRSGASGGRGGPQSTRHRPAFLHGASGTGSDFEGTITSDHSQTARARYASASSKSRGGPLRKSHKSRTWAATNLAADTEVEVYETTPATQHVMSEQEDGGDFETLVKRRGSRLLGGGRAEAREVEDVLSSSGPRHATQDHDGGMGLQRDDRGG